MKTLIFEYTPDEYAAELTTQTHETLGYLLRNGYLGKDDYHYLTGALVVAPVRNDKNLPQRIFERFFKDAPAEEAWVFPIVDVSEYGGTNTDPDPDIDSNTDTDVV
jgi:hypothetical protein